MYRKVILCLCIVLFSTTVVLAQDAQNVNSDKQTQAKELSGMSIVGNDEAPKSLYIVPWKSSDLGVKTSLDMMLTEGDVPVDRDVFRRQIEFYQIMRTK
jgi:hypothetical protein